MTLQVDLVAGARPNFMKLAPVDDALRSQVGIRTRIVHTGQHYDERMSEAFFRELGIRRPEVHLRVGSATHGQQTARILERYEDHLLASRPAATVVFGDVNSTIACALAAAKLEVPIVHVEAGLRSFDRSMPEEINRVLTDAVADLLLVSEPSGLQNLAREGISDERVRLVGNVMIDTLEAHRDQANGVEIEAEFGVEPGTYALVTMHRPSNVDDAATLSALLDSFRCLSRKVAMVFPVHPRTQAAADRAGLTGLLTTIPRRLMVFPPLPYVRSLALITHAQLVITDSGGVQEETSALGVPCLTLRDNTERPATVDFGTSRLVGNDPARIAAAIDDVLCGNWHDATEIPLWDGRAADRIAHEIIVWLGRHANSNGL